MFEPTTADWDRLRALCVRAGLPSERVDQIERCWSGRLGTGGGLTLLTGFPKTLALVLTRWLNLDIDNARRVEEGTGLVIGPNPESIARPIGKWPGVIRPDLRPRHLLALPSTGAVPSSERSVLGSLGIADQVLLISRRSQPMSPEERALADSLAGFAAIARVLFVAFPSEEVTEADSAELLAYGAAELEAHGFRDRSLGAGVWFTAGDRPVHTTQRIDDYLAVPERDAIRGRSTVLTASIAELLSEIEKLPGPKPDEELTPLEIDDRCRQFEDHVSNLGKCLNQLVVKGEFPDTDACRKFLAQSLVSWLNRPGQECFFLNQIEQERPGIKDELPDKASEAANELHYAAPPPEPVAVEGAQAQLVLALAAGGMAATLTYAIGALFLRDWLLILISALSAVAVFLVVHTNSPLLTLLGSWRGYRIGFLRRVIHGLGWFMRPRQEEPTKGLPPRRAALQGWANAELILINWFNGRLRTVTPTLSQECAAIRTSFQLED